MTCSMSAVEEYFKKHLERRTWQNLPSDTKTAAVETAETDVRLAINQDSLDSSDLLVFSAVCEQALYVAKCAIAESASIGTDAAQLKSETIEGVGRREYFQKTADGVSTDELAPRAALFLSRHPAFRSFDFSRG